MVGDPIAVKVEAVLFCLLGLVLNGVADVDEDLFLVGGLLMCVMGHSASLPGSGDTDL